MASLRMLPDLLILLAGLTTLALLLRWLWLRYAGRLGVQRLIATFGFLFAGVIRGVSVSLSM